MHLDPLSDKNLHSSNRPRCIMIRKKITTNSCGGLSEQRMWHHCFPHTNLSQPIQNQQTNLMPRSQIFAPPGPTQTIKSPENATGCPGPAPEPSQVRVEDDTSLDTAILKLIESRSLGFVFLERSFQGPCSILRNTLELCVFPIIASMRLKIHYFVWSRRTTGYCAHTRTHNHTHRNMHTHVDIITSSMLCAENACRFKNVDHAMCCHWLDENLHDV